MVVFRCKKTTPGGVFRMEMHFGHKKPHHILDDTKPLQLLCSLYMCVCGGSCEPSHPPAAAMRNEQRATAHPRTYRETKAIDSESILLLNPFRKTPHLSYIHERWRVQQAGQVEQPALSKPFWLHPTPRAHRPCQTVTAHATVHRPGKVYGHAILSHSTLCPT